MKVCAGDKIEKNEMGWACGAYGEEEGGAVYSITGQISKTETRTPPREYYAWC